MKQFLQNNIRPIALATIVISFFILSSWVSREYESILTESTFAKGFFGPLAYFILKVVDVIFAGFSSSPFIPLAKALWGTTVTVLLSSAGWTTGSLIAFLLARRYGEKFVRVGNHIAPKPKEVVALLEDMLVTYKAASHENIIKRISRLHLTFENIHPFVDGNGRIGRVINNYLLIREGYVPINIKFIDRAKYYEAFKEFDVKGEVGVMEEIVGKALTCSYHKRLAYLEGKKIVSLSEYAKAKKISHSNLLNKANRQTIEAFLEKGAWKIALD